MPFCSAALASVRVLCRTHRAEQCSCQAAHRPPLLQIFAFCAESGTDVNGAVILSQEEDLDIVARHHGELVRIRGCEKERAAFSEATHVWYSAVLLALGAQSVSLMCTMALLLMRTVPFGMEISSTSTVPSPRNSLGGLCE